MSYQLNLSFSVGEKVCSSGGVRAGQNIPADFEGVVETIIIDESGIVYEVRSWGGLMYTCAPEDLVSDQQ